MTRCIGKTLFSNGHVMILLNIDTEAPELSCPTNITIPAEDKLHYAKVRWPDPASRDNSGFIPMVTSIPVVEFPMKFKIGSTEIKVKCFLTSTRD